ncbi:MAG: CoA transferase [Deltaproteobacteria bacterium]|nr:CoA transferase [Deltaproteobacteria bacterium]
MAEGALSGIKVLDFGQYISGPYTAMLLAEQGADVIKIERPQGDPYRKEKGFIVWNRSKKAITLDLKKAEGRKIALDLAKQADVVIENYRPGIAEKLGIGYDTVQKVNPRIVYCSISGFGQKGPYRDIPGWEPLVDALASVYTNQGYGAHPLYIVLPLATHYAAFQAAFGITTALCVREMTGRGQKMDISLFRSIMGAQRLFLVDFPGSMRIPWGPSGLLPLYRAYQGSDGKWFFLGLGNFKFFTQFSMTMGRSEWLTDPLFEGAPFLILPPRNAQVMAMLKKIFAGKNRDEWLTLLRGDGVPCAPIRTIREFMDDPQVAANDMIVTMEEPGLGKVREMGIPVKLRGTPGEIKGPSPKRGRHTREILNGLGYSAEEIRRLQQTNVAR